ncbi:hypothetical protein V490_00525 [Pseudogymnoascus sp. VKM F-3557]|nr:hypothetical protein V490_00525 [Pseudogymnoascus sp. VKM F-3557]
METRRRRLHTLIQRRPLKRRRPPRTQRINMRRPQISEEVQQHEEHRDENRHKRVPPVLQAGALGERHHPVNLLLDFIGDHEVDGEGVFTQSQQLLAAQGILKSWRKEDGDSDEDGGNEAADPDVAVDEIEGGLVVGELAVAEAVAMHRRAKRPTVRRARRSQPETLRRVGDIVRAQLAQHPHHERRNGRRQKEAGNPTKRRFRDAHQRAVNVARPGLADRLERAHVTSHQREDGDADATLHKDANYRPFQEVGLAGGIAAGVGWLGVETAGKPSSLLCSADYDAAFIYLLPRHQIKSFLDYVDFLHPALDLREHISKLSALLSGIVEIGLPSITKPIVLETYSSDQISELCNRPLKALFQFCTGMDSQRAYAMHLQKPMAEAS